MKFNKAINSPFLNVFLFSLFWALAIIVGKSAFNAGAHPVTFMMQTTVVSLAFLTAYVLPTKFTEIKSMTKYLIAVLFAIGILSGGFSAFFRYIGTALTSATNVGFLGKTALVPTIIFAWILLGEKLNISKIISAFAMIFGVFLLTTGGQWITPQIGDVFMILASILIAIANVLKRKLLKENPISGEVVAWFSPMAGLLFFQILISLLSYYPDKLQPIFSVNLTNFQYFPYVLANGLLSALLVIFLNRTLKVASASYMTMMSMMTPVMVSLLAMMFLGERLGIIQTLGAFLIIVSGIIVHYLKIENQ